MKKKLLFYLLFFIILMGGCELTDDGSYVAPITNYEKLKGTWILNDIKQIDEIAKAADMLPDEMSLTSLFNFKEFKITFSVDEANKPTSFMVEGNVPDLFLRNGYWSLDAPHTHSDGTSSVILLFSDEAKTQIKDELTITTMPGASSTLEFRLIRYTGDIPFVSYQYKLKQTNQ